MKFYFLNTCYACPEQYDVYKANGQLCGYIRLRHGILRADYPNIDGDTIYEVSFKDIYKGIFDSDDERNSYLKNIAIEYKNKILEGIPYDIDNNEVLFEILTDISELEERLKYV